MRVRFNSQALKDIDEILTYLAERNPLAADKQRLHFEVAAERIGQNPYIGIAIRRKDRRRIVVGNYLIVYGVGADTITIEYVRHSARKRPWENE